MNYEQLDERFDDLHTQAVKARDAAQAAIDAITTLQRDLSKEHLLQLRTGK